jgi:hypothetical protein
MGQDAAPEEVAGLPIILRVVARCGYRPEEATVVAAPMWAPTTVPVREWWHPALKTCRLCDGSHSIRTSETST